MKTSKYFYARRFCALFAIGAALAWFLLPPAHSDPSPLVAQANTVRVDIPGGGCGSGIILKRHNSRGERLFVLTNAHVTKDHADFELRQFCHSDGRQSGQQVFAGHLLDSNEAADLALILMDGPAEKFTGLEFDGAAPMHVGWRVYHIGNLSGQFDDSYTEGIISQIGVHPEGGWLWDNLDQTTAIIVPGSSGGPVLNSSNGRIVGVACAWAFMPGIGFFIPVREVECWAHASHLDWAIRGHICPEDSTLKLAADLAKRALKPAKPPVSILDILRGQPKPEEPKQPEPDYENPKENKP